MKKKIAILGSTGSIGKTLLKIIKKDKKDYEIVLLSADVNYKELKSTKITSNDQIIEFKYLNNEDKFDFESIFVTFLLFKLVFFNCGFFL